MTALRRAWTDLEAACRRAHRGERPATARELAQLQHAALHYRALLARMWGWS